MKILATYPTERHYVKLPEVNWFEWDSNPASRIPLVFDKAHLERRTDVVSVDMSQADLEELQDMIARHNESLQDPVVHDAWQQYRTVLRLRGHR
jgi:hypothetical protein